MVETIFNRKALTEVYNILIMLDKEKLKKIPIDIIKAIENNMDTKYEVNWEEIEKGKMLEDAEKILSVLYTDYLATYEEKDIIMQLENLKYKDSYPVFKKNIIETNAIEQNQLAIEKKQNWIIRMFNKLLRLFKIR